MIPSLGDRAHSVLLLIFLLTTLGRAQLSSPSFTVECAVVLPAAGESTSANFNATTAVGGLSSGELASQAFTATLTVICGRDPGCGTTLCGDCDENSQVDILDALTAARSALGALMLGGAARANCDVNSDGAVNILDALSLAQIATGLPVVLTCC